MRSRSKSRHGKEYAAREEVNTTKTSLPTFGTDYDFNGKYSLDLTQKKFYILNN
jgi:hypothetical protein